MSKHIQRYIRCDVCGKDDLSGKTDFAYNSDWNIEQRFDICDQCSENGENGEIWHYQDIENPKSSRGNNQWGFVKYIPNTDKIELVKWLENPK